MFKQIVFAVDIEEKDVKSAFLAVAEVAAHHGAKVTVINVVPDYGVQLVHKYFPKHWLRDLIKETELKLAALIKQYMPASLEVAQVVGRGTVYESVINTAQTLESDLIVVSAHRSRNKDYLLGPNAAKIVRHAQVSVLILRDQK